MQLRRRRTVFVIALVLVVFTYGVGVGHYRWVPFDQLLAARNVVGESGDAQDPYAGPDDELLGLAFSGELSTPVMRPPATTLADVSQYNERIFTPVESLWRAEEQIEIVGAEQLDVEDVAPVVRVDFIFEGRARSAYAYGDVVNQHRDAVLIIPGSGQNKARAIASGDPDSGITAASTTAFGALIASCSSSPTRVFGRSMTASAG